MTPLEKKLIREIKRSAIHADWNLTFGGKSYGNHHLERVNKIAKFLSKSEKADEMITMIAAWVHDVPLIAGLDTNPQKNKLTLKKFLTQFALEEKLRNKIIDAAINHESGDELSSIEGKIVHDSDVLDKSGMLGVIRHAWKTTNLIKKRLLSGSDDLNYLESHLKTREGKLFTKSAIKLASKINASRNAFFADHEFAEKILEVVSSLAMEGKTSDQIANRLVKKYQHPCLSSLKSQLNCSYLT